MIEQWIAVLQDLDGLLLSTGHPTASMEARIAIGGLILLFKNYQQFQIKLRRLFRFV